MLDSLSLKQLQMHKNFFDRCQDAIDRGYYLEAIAMEYAAIEGRLEVILGLLGMPCSNNAPNEVRRNIKISHRIICLDNIRKHSLCMKDSKLDKYFFDSKDHKILLKWTNERNIYIHALYKNANLYQERKNDCKKMAIEGKEYCRLLYNETKRLRRLKDKDSKLFESDYHVCKAKACVMIKKNNNL